MVRLSMRCRFCRRYGGLYSVRSVVLALLLGVALLVPLRRAHAGGFPHQRFPEMPPVRLEAIPSIKLAPVGPPKAGEVARIKDLIGQLAQIDRRDFGPQHTVTGTLFAPIPRSEFLGARRLFPPDRSYFKPFVELVRLGPRALPFLLDALDDATPTKLVLKREGEWNMMVFDNDMVGNPANAREWKILAGMPDRTKGWRTGNLTPEERNPPPYTVTIGDVCFVAIGQIVRRDYRAFQYLYPTITVNSPTRDPSLVKAVRAIWSSENPAQHLLDSLLLDYATRGVNRPGKEPNLDEISDGNGPQSTATSRLLFYFSRQTAPLIARRLNRLRVQASYSEPGGKRSGADMTRYIKRELANDVRTADFIQAVVWCREPEIRASLLSLFRRTSDQDLLLAALPGLDPARHWSLVARRFQTVLRRQPYSEEGWYGVGQDVLIALRAFGGDKARPLYRAYLNKASVQRSLSVCEALRETGGSWDREFLWPMLSDKRPNGYTHPVQPNTEEPRAPVRLCDVAAEIISRHRKEVSFTLVGTTEELDRQIRTMQRQLGIPRTAPKR